MNHRFVNRLAFGMVLVMACAAAGAIATSETVARAAEAGVDPQAALIRNDAYEFFKALGDLVIIGPTGTNVADVMIALVNY